MVIKVPNRVRKYSKWTTKSQVQFYSRFAIFKAPKVSHNTALVSRLALLVAWAKLPHHDSLKLCPPQTWMTVATLNCDSNSNQPQQIRIWSCFNNKICRIQSEEDNNLSIFCTRQRSQYRRKSICSRWLWMKKNLQTCYATPHRQTMQASDIIMLSWQTQVQVMDRLACNIIFGSGLTAQWQLRLYNPEARLTLTTIRFPCNISSSVHQKDSSSKCRCSNLQKLRQTYRNSKQQRSKRSRRLSIIWVLGLLTIAQSTISSSSTSSSRTTKFVIGVKTNRNFPKIAATFNEEKPVEFISQQDESKVNKNNIIMILLKEQ